MKRAKSENVCLVLKALSCSEILPLTGRGSSVWAAPGIDVYPFLRIYAHPPMRQARPDLRVDGQSSSGRERILRHRLAFIFRPGFPKAEKYTHPRGRKVRNEGKRIKDQGYGRCIDPCPRNRPLPGTQAAYIRHPTRTGQLGASQGQVGYRRPDRTAYRFDGWLRHDDAASDYHAIHMIKR